LLETRRFRVLLYPEEPELATPGPPGSSGIGKNEKNRSEKRGRVYNWGRDGKMEILVPNMKR
jgi:hypothetical protein